MKKILIISPNWLGDLVMAQSLFIELKKQHKNCRIHLLGASWTHSLATRMPEISKHIIFENKQKKLSLKKRWLLAKQLQKEKYDLAIILPLSVKAALIPWLAKIPKRRGWHYKAWLIKNRFGLLNEYAAYPKDFKQVELYHSLHRSPFKRGPYPLPHLQTNEENTQSLQKKYAINPTQPSLIICPGAAYGPTKQWPSDYFTQVASHFIEKKWLIILIGAKKETQLCQIIETTIANKRCLNLCNKTHLDDVIDLLSSSTIILSNDSGLMHVAAAIKKRQIAIYGSSSPKFTPPLNTKASIQTLNLECSPCFKKKCPLTHYDCLKKLKPSKIISEIEKKVS
ncbi:MAG: lipopolysaccharide heptosyltransferase II [bacterium]